MNEESPASTRRSVNPDTPARLSKNDDPNGCPDTVMGGCLPVCARCGRDLDQTADAEGVRYAFADSPMTHSVLADLAAALQDFVQETDWAATRQLGVCLGNYGISIDGVNGE